MSLTTAYGYIYLEIKVAGSDNNRTGNLEINSKLDAPCTHAR